MIQLCHKLLNDSTVSYFETKKWIWMNDLNELSSGQYSASKDMSLKIQC